MSGETGVNPIEAMSESEAAEQMAEQMAYLGTDFNAVMGDLSGVVSKYVSGDLGVYEDETFGYIRNVAQNGIHLAQNVQGAVLEITDTDHENAKELERALREVDIIINY